jgi:FkbM family methyltransferase
MLANLLRSATTTVTSRVPRRGFFRSGWRTINRSLLRWGAPPNATFTTKCGVTLEVDLRAQSQVDAFYTRVYEPESMDPTLALYDKQGTFLDVGANIGFFSALVASAIRKAGGRGRVVAFEPFPPNVVRLRANLARNGLEDCCTIVELGLSERSQRLSLVLREDFRNGASSGNASVAISSAMDADFEQVEIALETLDDVWPELGAGRAPIDFVKVDIEGHEDCFFQGAQKTLRDQRPTVLTEVNRAYFRAKGVDIDQTLRPYLPPNYGIYRYSQRRWRSVPDFASCGDFENVLLVPAERLALERYREVFAS